MTPTITIIMATYNRAHFIVETLLSIQKQTFGDWECLIIDDGGTDNTPEVIAPILAQDTRFQYMKRPETYLKGLPGCRNYGLDLAQGTFVIFFDDDDVVPPDNLKISLDFLQKQNVAFCHYQKQAFENEVPHFTFSEPNVMQALNSTHLYDIITHQIGLASCTVLWDKKCFKAIRFKEELQYAEEWECYTRILSEGFEGIMIDAILYYNRKHPNSNTGEFFSHNPIRKKSNYDAILLVIANLKEKQLLTDLILRYFIQVALDYKEYQLFSAISETAQLSVFEKIKWRLFYFILPLRLYLYGFKKKLFS